MPTYLYKAVNDQGRTVRGKISTSNEFNLEQRLRENRLDLIEAKIQKESSFLARKVSTKDLVTFCIHLEQLEKAGVPMLEALEDLRDSTDSIALKEILSTIYDDVSSGEVLSSALSKHPKTFNDVFIGLVAAGEKTGNLPESLSQLAEHIRWQEDFRKKIKKASRYPIVLLVLMSTVIGVMMIFVVPKLVDFLTSQGFDLPGHTIALINFSDFMVNNWPYVFGLPIVFAIFFTIFYRTMEQFTYMVDRFILWLPFFGNVALKINMVRFTHFFAITFKSGIEVLECLEIGKKVVGNLVIKHSVEDITHSVSDGNSITQSIDSSGRFPSMVVRMFRVGEESGNMSSALENISLFYDREVKDSIDNVIGLIQPSLTIVMGAMMFWVISAVFGPLYQSFSNINF